jgi:Sec-independent protein translocase protein TatA
MFDSIGISEIVLVFLLALFFFDARDMVRIAKFLGAQYRRLENYWRKLKEDLMFEPPTPAELKAKEEIDHFYEQYRQKNNAQDDPATAPAAGPPAAAAPDTRPDSPPAVPAG